MYISRREKQINPTTFCALPKKYEIVDDYLIRGPHPCFCDVFTLKKEGVNQIYDFRHKRLKLLQAR